jgi:hypothetical protein
LGADMRVLKLIALSPETAGCRLQMTTGVSPAVP